MLDLNWWWLYFICSCFFQQLAKFIIHGLGNKKLMFLRIFYYGVKVWFSSYLDQLHFFGLPNFTMKPRYWRLNKKSFYSKPVVTWTFISDLFLLGVSEWWSSVTKLSAIELQGVFKSWMSVSVQVSGTDVPLPNIRRDFGFQLLGIGRFW